MPRPAPPGTGRGAHPEAADRDLAYVPSFRRSGRCTRGRSEDRAAGPWPGDRATAFPGAGPQSRPSCRWRRSSQLLLDRAEFLVEEGEMELIEPGVQGIAIAELASALTDLGPGGGAAARTDKTRLREVTHTCSYISTIYRVASLKLMGQALPAKISPVFLASPFMNFDTNAKTTDIIMFNSRNLGALIVDERPHVKEWDEPPVRYPEHRYRGKLRVRRAQRRPGDRCRQERPRPRQRVQPRCSLGRQRSFRATRPSRR